MIKKSDEIYSRLIAKHKKSLGSFDVKFTRESFLEWLRLQYEKQEGRCYYCSTSQVDINKIIDSGLLRSKRFKTRGRSLEIERLDAQGNEYSAANCVLVCYFCNNDKSDVVSSNDYIQFFGKSKQQYFQYLLEKLNKLRGQS